MTITIVILNSPLQFQNDRKKENIFILKSNKWNKHTSLYVYCVSQYYGLFFALFAVVTPWMYCPALRSHHALPSDPNPLPSIFGHCFSRLTTGRQPMACPRAFELCRCFGFSLISREFVILFCFRIKSELWACVPILFLVSCCCFAEFCFILNIVLIFFLRLSHCTFVN